MKRNKGKKARVSESVHQQLNMYALAASAAGVSVLALAQPSEARIVYTSAKIHIGGGQSYNLDLNHDGATDFTFYNKSWQSRWCGGKGAYFAVRVQDIGGQWAGSGTYVSALDRGAVIGPNQHFSGGFSSNPTGFMAKVRQGKFRSFRKHCMYASGMSFPWVNVSNRYVGLKFPINGKTHYGWARLSVRVGYVYIHATLTGYAYETIPNKAIKAGQTKGKMNDMEATPDSMNPDDPGPGASLTNPIPDKPQPASLGMLALGAQGVPLWRRKELALQGN